MIFTARKHLFAANIFFFFAIFILQKALRVFCFIEEKTCKNSICPADQACDESCVASTETPATSTASSESDARSTLSSPDSSPLPSTTPAVKSFRLIPLAMRNKTHSFGFGEGHYQMFVEEKQRQTYISKSRLNAAVAEVKLNPN